MAVARSEGFGQFSGDRGTSFGDLQMHIGGGLGDFYRRATGKNPADPHNELELDRFALDQAKRGGWAPWHGAAAKHIYGRYGMDYHAPVAGAPPTVDGRHTVSPGKPAAGTSAMRTEEHHHHIYMDGERVAYHVTKRQVADARFKRSLGPVDTYGRRAHPGSEVMDA